MAEIKGNTNEIPEANGERQTKSNAASWINEGTKAMDSENNKWRLSMWEKSDTVCIFRVPKSIMTSKMHPYVPSVVWLGPYRHNVNSRLRAMDQQKLLAVNGVWKRLQKEGKSLTEKEGASLTEKVEMLAKEIENLDDDIRKCYDEEIMLNKKDLSKLLVVDACFILEFFNLKHQITVESDILNDIMKVENQIPLFVLKAILKLEHKSDDKVKEELSKLLSKKFSRYPFPSTEPLSSDDLKYYIKERNPFHLLDLQRMVLVKHLESEKVPSHWLDLSTANNESDKRQLDSSIDYIPTAKLLHKAGIKFQDGSIGFERGVFSLPKIIVDDYTEIMLRNLMAYEECHGCSVSSNNEECHSCSVSSNNGTMNSNNSTMISNNGTTISQFVYLLDNLIESEGDVSVLKEDGVIENFLGSDKEVADIFNQICKGISVDKKSKFQSAAQLAKQYHDRNSGRFIRRVKEAYCSKPLYWVSIAAGTAVLVMTAVQMAYAIKNG